MVQVYTLLLDEANYTSGFQETLIQYLPKSGKLRIDGRLNTTSKLHTIAGELLARYSIGQYLGNPGQEIVLRFGEKGKPYIDNVKDIHFNISHSGHYVVCAIASVEIGIDVERVRKVNLRVAERFFSALEINDLMACSETERLQYFITLWTIKESYLKAIGRGLTQNLNSFTIVRNNKSYLLTGNKEAEQYGIETYYLSPEYIMAVCSPLPYYPAQIDNVSWDEIKDSLPILT